MKRASKIVLIFGAIIGLTSMGANLGAMTLFGFLGLYAGVGFLGPAITSMMSGSTDASYNMNMASYGVLSLSVGAVIVIACLITVIGLFIQSAIALINVTVLSDNKVGYILSIVYGALGIIMIDALIGFVVVLGGVLGLVAQIKENKKAKLEALEENK